ncbi:hypothetical protein [Ornithinibacillus scapharcae]|uniref:hypothetical protein n=1 Tax=Ornithinibacillus scapharcae TaxID=1147159 RepID=UPI000225C0E1|nr:hypothetical protein [Ornithinibacillus scapharcae]
MWDRLAGLYLIAILAGFALTLVPASAIITSPVSTVLTLIGGIIIVIFAIAIIHLAFRALFTKHTKS